MNRFLAIALAALLLLGTVPVAGAAPAVTSCTGQISGHTIDGDLLVPAGPTCDLENVTVIGNVHVGTGASLVVQYFAPGQTFIFGNLIAVQCGFVAAFESLFVGGNVQIEACTGPASSIGFVDATISGNFECSGNSLGCDVGHVTVGGNMQVNKNVGIPSTTVQNNYIGGNLQCEGNSLVVGNGNTVAGTNQGQCRVGSD